MLSVSGLARRLNPGVGFLGLLLSLNLCLSAEVDLGRIQGSAMSPDGVHLFAATGNQLVRSSDRGETWSAVADVGHPIQQVAAGPGAVLIASEGGVFRLNADGTGPPERVARRFGEETFVHLEWYPEANRFGFLSDKIVGLSDGPEGRSWTPKRLLGANDASKLQQLAYGDGNWVILRLDVEETPYTYRTFHRFHHSPDGVSWQNLDTAFFMETEWDAQLVHDGERFLAILEPMVGVHASTDGLAWEMADLSPPWLGDLQDAATVGGRLWLVGKDAAAGRNPDGTWSIFPTGHLWQIDRLIPAPEPALFARAFKQPEDASAPSWTLHPLDGLPLGSFELKRSRVSSRDLPREALPKELTAPDLDRILGTGTDRIWGAKGHNLYTSTDGLTWEWYRELPELPLRATSVGGGFLVASRNALYEGGRGGYLYQISLDEAVRDLVWDPGLRRYLVVTLDRLLVTDSDARYWADLTPDLADMEVLQGAVVTGDELLLLSYRGQRGGMLPTSQTRIRTMDTDTMAWRDRFEGAFLPGSTLGPVVGPAGPAVFDGEALRVADAEGGWRELASFGPDATFLTATPDAYFLGTAEPRVLRVAADGTWTSIDLPQATDLAALLPPPDGGSALPVVALRTARGLLAGYPGDLEPPVWQPERPALDLGIDLPDTVMTFETGLPGKVGDLYALEDGFFVGLPEAGGSAKGFRADADLGFEGWNLRGPDSAHFEHVARIGDRTIVAGDRRVRYGSPTSSSWGGWSPAEISALVTGESGVLTLGRSHDSRFLEARGNPRDVSVPGTTGGQFYAGAAGKKAILGVGYFSNANGWGPAVYAYPERAASMVRLPLPDLTGLGRWLRDVAFGAGHFVVIGENGIVLRWPDESADGLNGPELFIIEGVPDLISVDRVGDRFVATSADGAIFQSPDGSAWTRFLPATGKRWQGLVAMPDRRGILAVAEDGTGLHIAEGAVALTPGPELAALSPSDGRLAVAAKEKREQDKAMLLAFLDFEQTYRNTANLRERIQAYGQLFKHLALKVKLPAEDLRPLARSAWLRIAEEQRDLEAAYVVYREFPSSVNRWLVESVMRVDLGQLGDYLDADRAAGDAYPANWKVNRPRPFPDLRPDVRLAWETGARRLRDTGTMASLDLFFSFYLESFPNLTDNGLPREHLFYAGALALAGDPDYTDPDVSADQRMERFITIAQAPGSLMFAADYALGRVAGTSPEPQEAARILRQIVETDHLYMNWILNGRADQVAAIPGGAALLADISDQLVAAGIIERDLRAEAEALLSGTETTPPDYPKAKDLFTQVVEAGDAPSAGWLAMIHEYGKGTPVDYAEAKKWAEIGAAGGNTYSMMRLARYLGGGGYGWKDQEAAQQWVRKAAEAGNERAKEFVPQLDEGKVHRPAPYPVDPRTPFDVAARREAALAGDAGAAIDLAWHYTTQWGDGYNGGWFRDRAEAAGLAWVTNRSDVADRRAAYQAWTEAGSLVGPVLLARMTSEATDKVALLDKAQTAGSWLADYALVEHHAFRARKIDDAEALPAARRILKRDTAAGKAFLAAVTEAGVDLSALPGNPDAWTVEAMAANPNPSVELIAWSEDAVRSPASTRKRTLERAVFVARAHPSLSEEEANLLAESINRNRFIALAPWRFVQTSLLDEDEALRAVHLRHDDGPALTKDMHRTSLFAGNWVQEGYWLIARHLAGDGRQDEASSLLKNANRAADRQKPSLDSGEGGGLALPTRPVCSDDNGGARPRPR